MSLSLSPSLSLCIYYIILIVIIIKHHRVVLALVLLVMLFPVFIVLLVPVVVCWLGWSAWFWLLLTSKALGIRVYPRTSSKMSKTFAALALPSPPCGRIAAW